MHQTGRVGMAHLNPNRAIASTMSSKLYIETSIVSYLIAQPSRDIVTAARQQITRDWWQIKRLEFDL